MSGFDLFSRKYFRYSLLCFAICLVCMVVAFSVPDYSPIFPFFLIGFFVTMILCVIFFLLLNMQAWEYSRRQQLDIPENAEMTEISLSKYPEFMKEFVKKLKTTDVVSFNAHHKCICPNCNHNYSTVERPKSSII